MSSNIFLMENFSKSKLDPDLKMNVPSPNFLSHINASVFSFVVANKKIFVANVTILVATWSTVQLYDSIIFKTQHYFIHFYNDSLSYTKWTQIFCTVQYRWCQKTTSMTRPKIHIKHQTGMQKSSWNRK